MKKLKTKSIKTEVFNFCWNTFLQKSIYCSTQKNTQNTVTDEYQKNHMLFPSHLNRTLFKETRSSIEIDVIFVKKHIFLNFVEKYLTEKKPEKCYYNWDYWIGLNMSKLTVFDMLEFLTYSKVTVKGT